MGPIFDTIATATHTRGDFEHCTAITACDSFLGEKSIHISKLLSQLFGRDGTALNDGTEMDFPLSCICMIYTFHSLITEQFQVPPPPYSNKKYSPAEAVQF